MVNEGPDNTAAATSNGPKRSEIVCRSECLVIARKWVPRMRWIVLFLNEYLVCWTVCTKSTHYTRDWRSKKNASLSRLHDRHENVIWHLYWLTEQKKYLANIMEIPSTLATRFVAWGGRYPWILTRNKKPSRISIRRI